MQPIMIARLVMGAHLTWFCPSAKRLVTTGSTGQTARMTRELVNKLAATLPGAEVSDPWGGGHDAWKVGGKMFANTGAMGTGVSVKTPDIETATMLIEAGVAERAPYFHRSWVHLPFETLQEDELRHRLRVSYDLVFSKQTKKAQRAIVDASSTPASNIPED